MRSMVTVRLGAGGAAVPSLWARHVKRGDLTASALVGEQFVDNLKVLTRRRLR